MNIKYKLYGDDGYLEYTYDIEEFIRVNTDATDLDDTLECLGRLCDKLASKGLLSAADLIDIAKVYDATEPELL